MTQISDAEKRLPVLVVDGSPEISPAGLLSWHSLVRGHNGILVAALAMVAEMKQSAADAETAAETATDTAEWRAASKRRDEGESALQRCRDEIAQLEPVVMAEIAAGDSNAESNERKLGDLKAEAMRLEFRVGVLKAAADKIEPPFGSVRDQARKKAIRAGREELQRDLANAENGLREIVGPILARIFVIRSALSLTVHFGGN
jgi:hypothetical protein